MVMESEEQRFFAILNAFTSTNNEERVQAEAEYDQIPADKKISYLVSTMKHPEVQTDARTLCAVLLRRLLVNNFELIWPQMSEPNRESIKSEIVALVTQPSFDAQSRKKFCELCAELVRNLIDEDGNNTWPEFLQFMFQMVNAPTPELQQNALIIFGLVPTIFGQDQVNYLPLIKGIFENALKSDKDFINLEATNALASFILDNSDEEQLLKHFSDLVPGYLKVMQKTAVDGDDEVMKTALEVMSEAPKFFRPYLPDLLGFCAQLGSNEEADEELQKLALEFCVTACESIPGAVKKLGEQFVQVLVRWLLKLVAEIKDDDEYSCTPEEWAAEETALEELESDSSSSIGEAGLDRIAQALGGKAVLPTVMAQIKDLLQSPEWNYRYAGLMAVSTIGEGCLKQMEAYLPQIVLPVVNFLKDPDPRVRYAACNALGQMATDFAPTYEKKYHDKVIPGLVMLLEDYSCPRVQSHAGAALVNFCEECPKDILKNYADALVAKLGAVFETKLKQLMEDNTKTLVVEQLVTTIAAIANTLETDFAPYYETFMPCIKMIIQNGNIDGLKLLRGKSIECASLIGVAVGAEKFTADAADIMNLLLASQLSNGDVKIEEDDPQLSYMITAWARICKILGSKFTPYLPMVMEPVLKTAALKPEMQMVDEALGEYSGEIEGDDWEIVKLSEDQTLGIHTARLEDKAMACQMLVCYAETMKTDFRPFVDEVIKVILPLFKFLFLDSVRSSAAELVPHLLKCLDGDPNAQIMLWNMLKGELLSATEVETDNEVKCDQLYALTNVIEILPRQALDHEIIVQMTTLVEQTFEEHFKKCMERIASKQDEDYDDHQEEQLHIEMEDDNYLLTKAADITHAFLKVLRHEYLPYMEPKVIPYVFRLFEPDRHWQERQWGICVWDDLVEFTGPAAAKYQQGFLGHVLTGLGDSSVEVRQAAAYGCGVMAQYGGDMFIEICKQAWPLLVRIITAQDSRSEENVMATENAISAAGRIIKYAPNALNVNETIPLWLSWLPIVEDTDEVKPVLEFLCELVESNNPIAIGNLHIVLKIIAEVLHKKVLPDDSPLHPRLCQIVRVIQTNPELYQNCLAHLPEELQRALQF